MSAEAAALVRSWQVGDYTVTLTVRRAAAGAALYASMEWDPSRPRHRLTPSERWQYRAGRDAAIADLRAELGVRIGVIEV